MVPSPAAGPVEPGNPMVRPGSHGWYFLITSSTVGYGDLYPQTLPGRPVGRYVVAGGELLA